MSSTVNGSYFKKVEKDNSINSYDAGGGGGGGGTWTSFVRGCVATGLENWPIRRLKLAQKQTHAQTICNRNWLNYSRFYSI